MESLFRFILTRPAQKVDVESATVPLLLTREYHQRLLGARGASQPVPALRRVAQGHRQQNAGWSPSQEFAGESLAGFRSDIEGRAQMSLDDLRNVFGQRFGQTTPAALVNDPAFNLSYARLSDMVVTGAILGDDPSQVAFETASSLRTMALVRRLASSDVKLEEEGAIPEGLARTLLLPGDIFPLFPPTGNVPGSGALAGGGDASVIGGVGIGDQLTELYARRETLLTAYATLTRITPEHLVEPPPVATKTTERSRTAPPPAASRDKAPAKRRLTGGSEIESLVRPAPVLMRREAIDALESSERTALTTLGIDPSKESVVTTVNRISEQLADIGQRILVLSVASSGTMAKLGDRYYPVSGLVGSGTGVTAPQPGHLPSTHGSLTPAGVGDLLVVKQFLKRYEAREVSHIENILRGESKKMIHSRTDLSETTTTVEVETTKEEVRDQQTTERFELATESSNTIKEDSSLKAGLSLSGSYGPAVEFKASTDFATSHAKEEATKIGTKYSKDVTTRATSKIVDRHRRQVVTRLMTTVTEKNIHGFDNKDGDGPVVGQYQWVDKIYEAQVFNYGKRMLYDIMVPEPAAFLLYASTRAPKAQADLVKPDPFLMTPLEVDEWNYPGLVEKYAVVGVTPPPPPYVTSSKPVEGGGQGDDGVGTKSIDVPVPAGYQAISASVITYFVWFDDEDEATVYMSFGQRGNEVSVNGGGAWFPTLSNEAGSVSFAAVTYKIESFVTNIEVTCQRTPTALDEWKLKTHAAILQAYQQQLRDYQDQLAALQLQVAQQIKGRNPAANERMMRTELKKGAIALFTAQQYDWLNSIVTSPQGYPEINLSEAELEGGYIRFFEQAFEWEQMMYFLYPYYWGRKTNWIDRVLLDDMDPLFADFVKAGSARCVLPVRPGFESAVAYFLQTGQIWNGGDLPAISDPLYVSIIEEIKERDQAPGDEIPQGDPWEVRLPTSLVYLRDAATLPSWHKDAEGNWVPD